MASTKNPYPYAKTPVPMQDFYSVEEIAILLRVGTNRIYAWHQDKEDPLPLRRIKGKRRGYFVIREELLEWVRRHTE